MKPHSVVFWAASVAAAAGGGWIARGDAAPPAELAAAAPSPVPSVAATRAAPPLIAVADDGSVTLRIEQQPLDWVLEQIALHGGPRLARAAVANAVAPAAPVAMPDPGTLGAATVDCPVFVPVDPHGLLRTIEQGTGDAAADALQRARAVGLPLPETLLHTLVDGAASEAVRLAALDAWTEQRAGDPRRVREVLETARYAGNAAVQQEARRRLDELDEAQHLDAQAEAYGLAP